MGLKRTELTGGSRKQFTEKKLHGFCSSPNIIRLFESRGVGWAWHLACISGK
jgi:hypothetical protein